MYRDHVLNFEVFAQTLREVEELTVDRCLEYFGSRPFQYKTVVNGSIRTGGSERPCLYIVDVEAWADNEDE